MKKVLSIVILLAILVIGLTAAFSYQVPEIRTYTALSNIDTKIEQNIEVNTQSMAKNLNELQLSVQNLITIGETYTEETDVTTTFEQFNTAYQNTQLLQSQLTDLINMDLTNKLENTTSKLSAEQKKLADEAIELETTRLNELSLLYKQIEALNSKLAKTEEMFYTKKPSEAIQYFNALNHDFSTLEETYKAYADVSTKYFAAKSNLYESIIG